MQSDVIQCNIVLFVRRQVYFKIQLLTRVDIHISTHVNSMQSHSVVCVHAYFLLGKIQLLTGVDIHIFGNTYWKSQFLLTR